MRGLRASMSASTRRLNAIAAERAPTIATTIQSSFRPIAGGGVAAFAKRQQRAGQGERQGENRVLELDHVERQPQAFQGHWREYCLILPFDYAVVQWGGTGGYCSCWKRSRCRTKVA